MSATDAVHHKAAMADEIRTENYVEVMNAFIASERHQRWGAAHFPLPWSGRQEVDDQARVLVESETFWIAPNMVELAVAASTDMPDEPLRPFDLPATHGFMWLATPYRQLEVRRRGLSVNAFMWAVRGGAVRVWHYTHRSDPYDSMNLAARSRLTESQWRQLPVFSLNHVYNMDFGTTLPRGLSWDSPLPPDAKLNVDERIAEDGTVTLHVATDPDVSDQQPKTIRSPLAAFLLTIWRLCQQSLADRERAPLNSKQRRRLARSNLPETPVTVITLRRHGRSDDGEGGVEWSHRWIVRGHWRRQPCKDPDGEWTTRHIYINPFIKGPDDKPLLIRQHVNALTR